MKTLVRRLVRPIALAATLTVMVGGVGIAAGRPSEGGTGGAVAKASKRHLNRGPRGFRGPQGPPGSPGQGTPFGRALPTNVTAAPVFEMNGIRIEEGCLNGAVELTIRGISGDHNIIEVTSFDNSEGGKPRGFSATEWPVNVPVSMLVGGSGYDDYTGLTSVRTLGGQMTTIQWFAMGSINSSQGDCVVGGTASP